jgi:eukaryotic-like serine/threonine-protein kinase
MVTGRTPFDGDTPVTVAMRHIQDLPEPPSTYNPRVAPGLERIVLRCLEKDPRVRYPEGDALAYALENLSRQQGRRTSGPATPGRSQTALGRGGMTGAVGGYGGPAVVSNPVGPAGSARKSRAPSRPIDLPQGFGDAPTYDAAFDAENGGMGSPGTRPFGPAGATVPRVNVSGGTRPPGFGAPSKPSGPQKRNGPLVAIIVGAVGLLLLLTCVLLLVFTSGLGIFASPSATIPPATVTSIPTATAGSTVTVTATTSTQVTVPNVVGKSLAVADLTIQNANLTPQGVPQVDAQVTPFLVIRTSPPGGTKVAQNSVVMVYYSAPPPTATSTTAPPTATATCTPVTPPATPISGC